MLDVTRRQVCVCKRSQPGDDLVSCSTGVGGGSLEEFGPGEMGIWSVAEEARSAKYIQGS